MSNDFWAKPQDDSNNDPNSQSNNDQAGSNLSADNAQHDQSYSSNPQQDSNPTGSSQTPSFNDFAASTNSYGQQTNGSDDGQQGGSYDYGHQGAANYGQQAATNYGQQGAPDYGQQSATNYGGQADFKYGSTASAQNQGYDPNLTANPYGQTPGANAYTQYDTPGMAGNDQANASSYQQPYGGSYNQPFDQSGYAQGGYAPQQYGMPSNTSVLATWGQRALGGLIDYVAVGLIAGMISYILKMIVGEYSSLPGIVENLLIIGWGIYNFGYLGGTTGYTIGRRFAKIQLVGMNTGQPIGIGMAIVRWLAHLIDAVICCIGFLFPLWDQSRQTLADKICSTVVINNPPQN